MAFIAKEQKSNSGTYNRAKGAYDFNKNKSTTGLNDKGKVELHLELADITIRQTDKGFGISLNSCKGIVKEDIPDTKYLYTPLIKKSCTSDCVTWLGAIADAMLFYVNTVIEDKLFSASPSEEAVAMVTQKTCKDIAGYVE